MDLIPFEKVSLTDAKAALDGKPAPLPAERNWAAVRDASGAKNTDLTRQAWEWLDALPRDMQPGGVIQRFPRIANKLAELWCRPTVCATYLDALILDQRGSRKGFPPDVAGELALLKTYLNRYTGVARFQMWDERNTR
jgi:hypothetical protein